MRRLVEVLGMPPTHMIEQAPPSNREHFFQSAYTSTTPKSAGSKMSSPELPGRPSTKWRLKETGEERIEEEAGRE